MASVNCTCPKCNRYGQMILLSERKGGFSGGKAAAGAVLLGPVGLLGGALGKSIKRVKGPHCGYTFEK